MFFSVGLSCYFSVGFGVDEAEGKVIFIEPDVVELTIY